MTLLNILIAVSLSHDDIPGIGTLAMVLAYFHDNMEGNNRIQFTKFYVAYDAGKKKNY